MPALLAVGSLSYFHFSARYKARWDELAAAAAERFGDPGQALLQLVDLEINR